MARKIFLNGAVLALALAAGACDEEDPMMADSADDTSAATEGAAEISLADDAMPIIAMRCGGCHTRTDSPAPAAVVNMAYFEEPGDILGLVGTFIQAGDSANSGLIAIMRQDMAVGMGPTVMPPPDAGDAMPEAEVDTIALWIDQGAQDN